MKREVMLFLVVIILISGASCESVETQNNASSLGLQKQVDELKLQVSTLNQEKEALSKENADLKSKYQPREIGSSLDLTSWSADDILDKFIANDNLFAKGGWYTYEYDGENYYSKFDQSFYGKDEFYELAYKIRDREVNISHLRIFKLGLKKDATQEYDDYLNKIGTKASIDPKMQCISSVDCRDISVTECSKNGKKFFAWFADNWLFTARDDGYALGVFKKIYC